VGGESESLKSEKAKKEKDQKEKIERMNPKRNYRSDFIKSEIRKKVK